MRRVPSHLPHITQRAQYSKLLRYTENCGEAATRITANLIYSISEVLPVRSLLSRTILHWERSILAEEKVSSTYSLKLLPQQHRVKWWWAAPWQSKSPPPPRSYKTHIGSPLKGPSEQSSDSNSPSQSRGSLFHLPSPRQRRGSGRTACRGESVPLE